MKDGNYAWEKLYNAVTTFVSGGGTLKQRLTRAYLDHLVRLFKPEHHVPWPATRSRFEAVMAELCDGGIDRLSHPKAKRLAVEILNIYDAVTRHIAPNS